MTGNFSWDKQKLRWIFWACRSGAPRDISKRNKVTERILIGLTGHQFHMKTFFSLFSFRNTTFSLSANTGKIKMLKIILWNNVIDDFYKVTERIDKFVDLQIVTSIVNSIQNILKILYFLLSNDTIYICHTWYVVYCFPKYFLMVTFFEIPT